MKSDSAGSLRRGLMRGVAVFTLVLGLFWAVWLAGAASYGRTVFLLSLTAAGTAAVNLAFVRHLRRVYASPRRGVWRRV